MPRTSRKEAIQKLQVARKDRLCITYITSTRAGHEIQIADDAFRIIYNHLELGKDLAKNGVDLLIHSNGGSSTVPWRIVNLIRQYTQKFAVLVPYQAFSAATLIALGADEILMHKMGCLGPIDPSVANIFNPPHPSSPGQLAPISVEDVTVPQPQSPLTTQQILQQIQELAKHGVGVGAVPEETLVKLAVAMIPFTQPVGGAIVPGGGRVNLDPITGVVIESAARADVFKSDLAIERLSVNTAAGPQDVLKQEVLWQRWEEET